MLIKVGSPEEPGSLQGRQSRVINLEKEKSEHFRWTNLEQVQHCNNLLLHVTFAHTLTRARVWMNVAAHPEKKNEKTGKREAEEERKQATDFKETLCCSSAVIQRAPRRKNDLCEGSARGNWDVREGQQPFRPNPKGIGYRTTTLRRLLIGAGYRRVVIVVGALLRGMRI